MSLEFWHFSHDWETVFCFESRYGEEMIPKPFKRLNKPLCATHFLNFWLKLIDSLHAILNFQICIVNFSIFLQPYCLRNTLYYWSLPDLTSFILRHWSFRNAVVDGLYYNGCSFVCVYRQFSYTVCDELCWTVPDKRTQRGSTGGCQNLLSASHTLPQCRRL